MLTSLKDGNDEVVAWMNFSFFRLSVVAEYFNLASRSKTLLFLQNYGHFDLIQNFEDYLRVFCWLLYCHTKVITLLCKQTQTDIG